MEPKRTRRSKMEIAETILKLCQQPSNQTHLMGHADLNQVQIKPLLNYLVHRNFIVCSEGYYMLTQYGAAFLDGLECVLEMWNSPMLAERAIPIVR